MKLKFLTVVSLTALIGAAGCGRDNATNANTANTNANMTSATPMATMTPMATATPAASPDAAAKAAVEDALRKKGITGVTVDATTTEVTLRGTVAKGKMTEAVMAATEAGKRKVNNELTEAK